MRLQSFAPREELDMAERLKWRLGHSFINTSRNALQRTMPAIQNQDKLDLRPGLGSSKCFKRWVVGVLLQVIPQMDVKVSALYGILQL